MKVLIIPDIHLKFTVAEIIIDKVKPDQIVFLGDTFDDFNDTYELVASTAEWFRWSINQPNRIHVCGNHDVHYWFAENSNVRCSGYEKGKSIIINNRVKPEDWAKLKFFHVLDNWVLSHGGVHPYWIDPTKYRNDEPINITQKELVAKLERDSVDCIKELSKGKSHWFEICGFARSRSPFVGGLLWCDFNEEFEPIRGIHQIVGHTPSRIKIRWSILKENDNTVYTPEGAEPELTEKTSFNVCFDSYPALKWCAIYEEKSLKIIETKSL